MDVRVADDHVPGGAQTAALVFPDDVAPVAPVDIGGQGKAAVAVDVAQAQERGSGTYGAEGEGLAIRSPTTMAEPRSPARPEDVRDRPTVAKTAGHDAPVSCSSGQPSASCAAVVGQLTGAGAEVRVHADFDPGGFGVVSRLCELGAAPWRMGASDYRAALDRSGPRTVTGPVRTPAWDRELASPFGEHRRPVYEEQVLDTILG